MIFWKVLRLKTLTITLDHIHGLYQEKSLNMGPLKLFLVKDKLWNCIAYSVLVTALIQLLLVLDKSIDSIWMKYKFWGYGYSSETVISFNAFCLFLLFTIVVLLLHSLSGLHGVRLPISLKQSIIWIVFVSNSLMAGLLFLGLVLVQ